MALEKSRKRQIKNVLWLALFIFVLTFVVTLSIGLGAKGFDSTDVLLRDSFYRLGASFFIGLAIILALMLWERDGDKKYGVTTLFASQGEIPSAPFWKRFSQFQIGYIFLFAFIGLSLFVVFIKQNTFVAFGQLEQQFTPVAELLYSTLLVPGSENLGLAFVMALFLLILGVVARRTNMDVGAYRTWAYLGTILSGGLYWVINHLLRYSGNDLSLIVVFGFGIVMATLTVWTGSFLPAWELHLVNNFFIDVRDAFSRDAIIGLTILVLIGMFTLYFYLFKGKLLGSSQKERELGG